MGLIVDTNFLISMEREAKRGDRGIATGFLEKHASEQFFMPFIVFGEMACGQSAADKRKWQKLCGPFTALPWTKEIAWQYGEIYRNLKSGGNLIGANDMWIAATAIVHGMPLVTNNLRDFERIPDLGLLGY